MRILIATPTFESIFPESYQSIWDLDKGDHEVIWRFVKGYDCATARNKIARMALDMKADYVLMVDNDVVLEKDTLLLMLEDAKDVCLGYYAHRDTDNVYRGRTCVCKLFYEDAGHLMRYFNYPLDSEYTEDELREFRENGEHKIQIHGGGMGCALIKRSVFETIEYPWYDWRNYASGSMLSEDLDFCEKCKKAKIPIYTDSRAGVGHILRHVQKVI